jgi:YD repeat-containing protein
VEGVDYTLDADGNRLTAGELIAAPVGGGALLSRTVSYAYDALNRLTGASYTDGAPTESYSYDAAGNRPSATIGGTTTSSTFDSANRLLTRGGDSYTYDADGNTLTAGARTYAWNAANRMVSVTLAPGANPITYAYNGDGVLVSRGSLGQSTAYLQDLAAGLPVVLRENGPSGQIDYTWAKGLVSQQDPTGYYTTLADGLGSVRALANSQGQIVGSFAYDAYGNVQGTPGGTVSSAFGFAGEQTDPTSGLLNLRARS